MPPYPFELYIPLPRELQAEISISYPILLIKHMLGAPMPAEFSRGPSYPLSTRLYQTLSASRSHATTARLPSGYQRTS